MTIVAVESFYLAFRLYYVISKSDLYHRAWLEGFLALMNKSRLGDFVLYFAYNPSYMSGSCTIGLISMASTHWWQPSRLSFFTSYFACITSYPNRSLECVYVLMGKSRLSDFDPYSIYSPTDMTGICTIGLTSMASTYWSLSSLVWDFTTYFPYLKSHPGQCNKVYPEFRLLSNRHSRDLHHRTHLDCLHPLMTIITVEWFYIVFRLLYYVIS